MLNIKVTTWSLGLFLAISFILCVIYGLITPQNIHMHPFLENVLPGFKWLSIGSFFLGLIESFFWGVYIGLGYGWIHNFLYKKLVSKQL